MRVNMLPELLTHCAFIASKERVRGRQGSFHSTCPPYGKVVLRPQNADTCKEETLCLHISKWDIRLIVALVHSTKKKKRKRQHHRFWLGKTHTLLARWEASPVPEPIIVQEADMVHGLDESLSCHLSVSHSDCGKANYRWLNVPFFSLLSGVLPGRTLS